MIICIATAIAIVWPETFCERKIESFKNPVAILKTNPKRIQSYNCSYTGIFLDIVQLYV